MRKWRDSPPAQMEELTKATIIFLGVINAFTVMYILFSREITGMQVFGLASGSIIIYLMVSGKYYSILRWYADYRSKQRDNRWR